MSALTPALDNALAGPSPTVFGAVLIELPTADIALLSGAGVLTFGGRDYVGRDSTYGTLAAIENIAEGMGDTAPAISITMMPASDAAAADLAGPTMQGSPVTVTVGALDPATGIVIGTHVIGLFEIDVPTLSSDEKGRALDIECVSAHERFFADDEGIRLSPDWHKSVWPGETGLDDVTGVTQPIYWGVQTSPGTITLGGGIGAIADGYNYRRVQDQ